MIEIQEQVKTGAATVISISDDDFVVKTSSNDICVAKMADSCMMVPSEGDKVGLFNADEELYIVHVLQSSYKRIALRGDEISLHSNRYRGFTQTYENEAKELHIRAESFKCEGKRALLRFAMLETIAGSLMQSAAKVLSKFGQNKTLVEGHDEVQCNTSKHITREHRIQRSNNLVMTAKEQMKLDAENIHLA